MVGNSANYTNAWIITNLSIENFIEVLCTNSKLFKNMLVSMTLCKCYTTRGYELVLVFHDIFYSTFTNNRFALIINNFIHVVRNQ